MAGCPCDLDHSSGGLREAKQDLAGQAEGDARGRIIIDQEITRVDAIDGLVEENFDAGQRAVGRAGRRKGVNHRGRFQLQESAEGGFHMEVAAGCVPIEALDRQLVLADNQIEAAEVRNRDAHHALFFGQNGSGIISQVSRRQIDPPHLHAVDVCGRAIIDIHVQLQAGQVGDVRELKGFSKVDAQPAAGAAGRNGGGDAGFEPDPVRRTGISYRRIATAPARIIERQVAPRCGVRERGFVGAEVIAPIGAKGHDVYLCGGCGKRQ